MSKPRNHVRQKLLFRLFWANERLDRWGTWPAPGRRSTGLGHQDPRSGEPSSQTGPPYSSWKSGEWKIQPRICGKCGFFFHLGGMFSTSSGCPLRWGANFRSRLSWLLSVGPGWTERGADSMATRFQTPGTFLRRRLSSANVAKYICSE